MCIAIVLVTISMDTFAQRVQFKGVVKDESLALVPGVSVIIKGSRTGTSTQSDGTFVISAEKGQTLVISSIGFVSQQIVLGSQTMYFYAYTAQYYGSFRKVSHSFLIIRSFTYAYEKNDSDE